MITFDQRWRDPYAELTDFGSYLVFTLNKQIEFEMGIYSLMEPPSPERGE